jgi:hypothetical protein
MHGDNNVKHVTFIDLEKAFDKVNWKLLFKRMKKVGLDWKDRRLILALYRSQNAIIEINGNKEVAAIKRGVRQGCPLSPYLFNMFIEEAITMMKQKTKAIHINGKQIHSIRFADDIAILAD